MIFILGNVTISSQPQKRTLLETLLQGDNYFGLQGHKSPLLGGMLSCLSLHLLPDALCIPRTGRLCNKIACRNCPLRLTSGDADGELYVSPPQGQCQVTESHSSSSGEQRMSCPYAGSRRFAPRSELLLGPKQEMVPDGYVWGK